MTKVGELLEAIPNNARFYGCLKRFYEMKSEKKWLIGLDEDFLIPEETGKEIEKALETCYKLLADVEIPEELEEHFDGEEFNGYCFGQVFRKHIKGFLTPKVVYTYTPRHMFKKMNLIEFLQSVSDEELRFFKDYVSIDVLREVFNAKVR